MGFLDAIDAWVPIKFVILVGGVAAGLVAIRTLIASTRRAAKVSRLSLEYAKVWTEISVDRLGHLGAVEVKARLINPESVTLRVKALEMRTSFEGRATNVVPSRIAQLDVAAWSSHVDVGSPPLPVRIPKGKNSAEGRIDWSISYGKLDSTDSELPFTLEIHGRVEIHSLSHGFETRWVPDPNSATPVLRSEAYFIDDNGDFHLLNRGGPIQ